MKWTVDAFNSHSQIFFWTIFYSITFLIKVLQFFLLLQESIPKYKTFSVSIVIIEKPNKHKISRIDTARAMNILCGSPRPDRSRSKSQLNNIRGFAWASIVLVAFNVHFVKVQSK